LPDFADDAPPAFKQDRSVRRRQQLEEAAIAVIARHGIAGLTHRLVARAAGVSLGPTTYYFKSRADIVHAASETVLRTYVTTFAAAADRHIGSPGDPGDPGGRSIAEWVLRLLRHVAGDRHVRALCWAEITLNGPRDSRSLDLGRDWQASFLNIWGRLARAAGHAAPDQAATATVDFLIGAVFMTLALDLDQERIEAVFRDGGDPLAHWPLEHWREAAAPASAIRTRLTPKAARTAERAIEATITLLVQEGPAAVSLAAVARMAQVTPAALSYHFPTLDILLAVAQRRLFLEAKERYRLATRVEEAHVHNLDSLTDLTSAIFVREATEFGLRNVAAFSLWLEAARKPELRGVVYQAIADQQRAWMRVLSHIKPQPRPSEALMAQTTFIGRLIRVISTGSSLEDLAMARANFLFDFQNLAQGDFLAH